MACGAPALLAEETAGAMPAIRDVVFSTTLTSGGLRSVLQAALAVVGTDPGLRARVAELAHERWLTDAVVTRYEALLGVS